MYRFSYKSTLKELDSAGLLDKKQRKYIKGLSPTEQVMWVLEFLLKRAKQHNELHRVYDEQGTIGQLAIEADWLGNPISYHIEVDMLQDLMRLGQDYIRSLPEGQIIQRIRNITDLDPIIIHTYRDGKAANGSCICGRITSTDEDCNLYVAAETLTDRWLTSETVISVGETEADQLRQMMTAAKHMWHLANPMLNIERDRDNVDDRDITCNMLFFQTGLALYEGNFPDLVVDGLPDNLLARPVKEIPKVRTRTINWHRSAVDSLGGGTVFVRRPHFRILGSNRFKRNADGTPKVVLIPAAEVKLTNKQRSYTVKKVGK